MAQRAEQKARTRQAIFDAARQAFLDHGPDVAVDTIADAAGVSKPTVFFHFGSRVNLQMAVAYDGFRRMFEQMQAIAGEGTIRFIEAALQGNVDEDARLVWAVGDALAWTAPGSTEGGFAEIEAEIARRLGDDGLEPTVIPEVASLITNGYVMVARRLALGGAPEGFDRRFVDGVRLILECVAAGRPALAGR